MAKPVFLLGVGANKAGTSFLYRTLLAHPRTALSVPKELHIFDALFLPDLCGYFRRKHTQALITRLAAENFSARNARWKARTAAMMQHVQMYYDPAQYPAWFRGLSRNAALTGEITPAYQMLEAGHFATIRDLMAPDFDIRVVFLMRDPVERIFSALRMEERNGRGGDAPAHVRFASEFRDAGHVRRSDYEHTVRALDATFAREQIFYGFFENLFTPESFARLENFLGLSGLKPDFETRVNASPTRDRPGADAIAAARAFHAPAYDFCAARFGAETIHRLWKHA